MSSPIFIPKDFKLQAIATDMDGTFFGTQLCILESTLQAYRRAVQLGIPVLPATGRVKEGVEYALQRAGAMDVKLHPGVYLNGCLTYGEKGKDDIVWERHVPIEIVKKMIEFEQITNQCVMKNPEWQHLPSIKDALPEHGFHAVKNKNLKPIFCSLCGYSDGGIIISELNQLTDGIEQFQEGKCRVVGSLLEHAKKSPIHKLLFVTHSGQLMKRLREEINDLIEDNAVINAAVPRILELAPRGVNKGEGLARLANSLGLSLESIACLGDGENDIDMLKRCGFSVAMGNAGCHLRSIAHAVTKSNNEGGWALAINALLDKFENDRMKRDQPELQEI